MCRSIEQYEIICVVLFGTWTFVIATEAVEKFLQPLTTLNIGAEIEISENIWKLCWLDIEFYSNLGLVMN